MSPVSRKAPLRGALLIGAGSAAALGERLRAVQQAAAAGQAPAPVAPSDAELHSPERLSIDYGDAAELADKAAKALKALAADQPRNLETSACSRHLPRSRTGAQGGVPLYRAGLAVREHGAGAARRRTHRSPDFCGSRPVLTPLLGKPLSEFIFIDGADAGAVAQAEDDLRQTAITQPAVSRPTLP